MKTRDLENTLNKVQDTKSLKQYIQTIQNISYDAFHEYFNQLIQEKNLNRSEIIEHSGIERTYCYHILNGTKIHPEIRFFVYVLQQDAILKKQEEH